VYVAENAASVPDASAVIITAVEKSITKIEVRCPFLLYIVPLPTNDAFIKYNPLYQIFPIYSIANPEKMIFYNKF